MGTISEAVQVSAEAPLLNAASAEQIRSFDSQELRALPISQRDWTSVLPLQAGAQSRSNGLTINGLPLMTNGGFGAYDVNNLDRYYSDCVIGGPGAFMIPVNDWTQFPEAIRRKLVLELAGRDFRWPADDAVRPPVVLAADTPASDCQVGEKMWRDRTWMFENR